MPEELTLEEALEVLCAFHIKALEFQDWRVEMGPSQHAAPWDWERYIPAWTAVRKRVLEAHGLPVT